MKVNIIGLTPFNKFDYQFINPGLTFICSFLKMFGLSSWWLSSHRRFFIFGISFLFWISHWVFCIFLNNISPLSGIVWDRSHIGSLMVHHNIIHWCVIRVWKMLRDYKAPVSLEIKVMKVGLFYVHASYDLQEKRFLITYGGILNISYDETDTLSQEQAHHQ